MSPAATRAEPMSDAATRARPPEDARWARAPEGQSGQRPSISLVAAPSPALKARQLLDEARRAALEHLRQLQSSMETVRALADSVVEGGELYAPGLPELAGRLSEDLFWRAKTLEMLSQRQRDAFGPATATRGNRA